MLPVILRQRRYPLQTRPDTGRADRILLCQPKDTLAPEPRPICYLMTLDRIYEDMTGESTRLFGNRSHYILRASDIYELERPFDLDEVKITSTLYAEGGAWTYVAPQDAQCLEQKGLLKFGAHAALDERIRELFHDLWCDAGIQGAYDKADWNELQSLLKAKGVDV